MAKILVLHGPNLNLLGKRETEHYGTTDLATIDTELTEKARAADHTLHCQQSQSEAALIEAVQQASPDGIDFIIFNPAAFTHTSIALRDALLAVNIPFIEVHLSNPYARESFRHTSYFSDVAQGVICGFGAQSYELALDAALNFIANQNNR